jgi:hypothetical protein
MPPEATELRPAYRVHPVTRVLEPCRLRLAPSLTAQSLLVAR